MYKIYITNIGTKTAPVFQGMGDFNPDKVVLVNSRKSIDMADGTHDYGDTEHEIRKALDIAGLTDIETLVVEPYDYHDVYNKVKDLTSNEKENHPGCRFRINMTMGTHVMAAAVCAVAYVTHSELCYVKRAEYNASRKDELVMIDIENQDELAKLKKLEKTMEVFKTILSGKSRNEDLRAALKMGKSTLSYHISILKEHGLIMNQKSARNQVWVITKKGEETIKRL